MKKYMFLLICLFLGVFCFAAAAEGEPTVYVSSAQGNDESAGKEKQEPAFLCFPFHEQ